MAKPVVDVLSDLQEELSAGALVTIDAQKQRARILPL
jgi:hypothetical protein